jgi:hypothetical protein
MPALVVAELSATAVIALASVVVVYLLIIAIVALAAVFHADPLRRADAHRVLTALLTVVPRGAGRERGRATSRTRSRIRGRREPDL